MHHVALVVWRLDRLEDLSDNYLQMKKKILREIRRTKWWRLNLLLNYLFDKWHMLCLLHMIYLNSIIYVNSKVLISTSYWVKLFKIHFLQILSKSRAGVTSWLLNFPSHFKNLRSILRFWFQIENYFIQQSLSSIPNTNNNNILLIILQHLT